MLLSDDENKILNVFFYKIDYNKIEIDWLHNYSFCSYLQFSGKLKKNITRQIHFCVYPIFYSSIYVQFKTSNIIIINELTFE